MSQRSRIAKLEGRRPRDLQVLSGDELQDRIDIALAGAGGLANAREMFTDEPVLSRMLSIHQGIGTWG